MDLFWVLVQHIAFHSIGLFIAFSLHILEIIGFRVVNNFRIIIKKHTRTPIRQQIPQTILSAVIDPLLHIHLTALLLRIFGFVFFFNLFRVLLVFLRPQIIHHLLIRLHSKSGNVHCFSNTNSTVQKRMLYDLVQSWSFAGIQIKNPGNQVLSTIGNFNAFREGVNSFSNFLISLFNFRGLERRLTNNNGIHHHSERPNIHFVRMPLSVLKHFRGQVIRRTTNCMSFFVFEIQSGCQSEVSQLDL